MLFTHPSETNARMDMPRKIISVRPVTIPHLRPHLRNIMDKRKRPDRQDPRTYLDPRFLVPVVMQDIVIPLDQPDTQIGKVLSPFQKKRELLIFPAMKQIADHQQLTRPEILNLTKQP